MTVRFVVLGCGRIGSMHAAYLHRRVAGAEVVGVFDVVAEAAESVGAELGVPVAADLEAALAIDADAVAICTSTDTHVDVMIAAAEAGRAIFCEKPVSLDVAEVDRALAAVKAAGVPLHIGFNRRFDPSHKAVADAVADGAIGDVEVVNITSRDPAPPPIAYIEVSGGIFHDIAIHDFDMARYVTGSEVESVYALGRVRVDPRSGRPAMSTPPSSSHPRERLPHHDRHQPSCRLRLRPAGRGLRQWRHGPVDQPPRRQRPRGHRRGYRQPPLQNFFLERYTASYLDQWEAFVAAVENGTPPPISGADGRAPLVIGMAAKRSMDEGRPVLITEII